MIMHTIHYRKFLHECAQYPYYPQKIKINKEKRVIEISGLQKEFTNTTLVEDGPKKYILKYVIINGRFYIDEIKEKAIKN